MSSALLQVYGLTLATPRGAMVENLSFRIDPGEIVALTGKSGSGKTSIALAILDLLPSGIQLKQGTITWFGKDQQNYTLPNQGAAWADLRGKHIGYTQQDVFGAFDPVLTMGRQMLMVIKERAGQVDVDFERELRIKMEEVGLHDIERLLQSYPHQLSGGQLQRCQISMAIVMRPELLISDEPTSAIDKINQLELLDVFTMLKNKYNTAILCITHEEAVVRHLAEREIQLDVITREFALPQPLSRTIGQEVKLNVLEVKGLVYTHSFGGMMYSKGATIGELDFKVQRGSCLGIVGESGSGKSTLAQLLVGLYTPSKGEVLLQNTKIDFQNSDDIIHLRSKVQLVMQDGRGSLHPYIDIRSLLNQVIGVRQKLDPAFRVDLSELVKSVGLDESVLDRKSPQLSGGECLRVSIARALVLQPEVLICDESTSALDGPTRDGIIDLLLQLMKSRGLALIFISHDEHIIRAVSHEILVLSRGKIVEKGAAGDIINYPTHEVTKRIFGTHIGLEKKTDSHPTFRPN